MAEVAKKNEVPATAPVPPIQVNVQMPEPKVRVEPEVKGRISQRGGRFGIWKVNPDTGKRRLAFVNCDGDEIA